MKMERNLPIIAILGGTGKEGPGLALRWATAGYLIIIGSRSAEKAQITADDLNTKLGINSIRGMVNDAAARSADICVLTVVHTAHQAALESVREALQGKLLIDATARMDFRDPQPPLPPAAAQYAQELLGPGVKVVAAFQNVPAHLLKQNLDQPLNADVLVCADEIEAAEVVMQLATDAGMRAYYAGELKNALIVESLTALLISMNKYYKVKNSSISITGIPQPNLDAGG